MKKEMIAAIGVALITTCGAATAGCKFEWTHYGPDQINKLIGQSIGAKVTDNFCARYNKTHEIVIISDAYSGPNRTLGHVAVALRKRGVEDVPTKRHTAYKFEEGNFVVGKSYELAAALALDTVMDVMSDLDSYVN
jgi:hypothetical protein